MRTSALFLRASLAASALSASVTLAACGLDLGGTYDTVVADAAPPTPDAGARDAAPPTRDATTDTGAPPDAAPVVDSATPDAGAEEAAADAGCTPVAGFVGALPLSSFILKGTAAYNENADSRITLTNSANNQSGAAWYPTKLPVVGGYDLSFRFRVGPANKPGDGITFAVIESAAMPGAGDDGDGLGLRNGAPGAAGYAVALDMYYSQSDPNDVDKTTLQILTMPGFTVVAKTGLPAYLNDGNEYTVDVSWRAPGTVTATLHAPAGTNVAVQSSDPGVGMASPAFLGFTASTGGGSSSHNEIAGIDVASTCP